MGRSLLRAGLVLVLGLTLVAGSLAPQMPASFGLGERAALAADASISTCDWASFSAAVDAVQASGGGTITFDCTGTITFAAQKTITSDVTIIGDEQVTFDGDDGTRLFIVNAGARLELIGLTLQNGSSDTGAAIKNFGTLDVIASTFSDNITSDDGGAIDSSGGVVTITGSAFTGNIANNGDGGAINNSGGTLTVIRSTFTDNSAAAVAFSRGGAIHSQGGMLTVTASAFSGNNAAVQGGAVNTSSPTTITASTFSENSAGLDGGAIRSSGNTLNVSASTFVNNTASANGGAIYMGGTAIVTTSTFTANTAVEAGGALLSGGTLLFTAGAVVDNTAGDEGGGFHTSAVGTTTITGSIVALNTAPDGPNCQSFGTQNSGGSNLSNNAGCGFSPPDDITNSASIDLGDLADNGGPTETMLPVMETSDAIDAADCGLIPGDDQRGAPRPLTACDIGPVEVEAVVPVQIVAFVATSVPVNEGDTVGLLAIAYGPDNGNLSYAFDCDDDGGYETAGSETGTSGTGLCTLPDDGLLTVGLQVCDGGDGGNCDTAVLDVDVPNNLPPVIDGISTDAPVPQGQPVTVTVAASDAGVNDTLTYSFDCDNDGSYETPGTGNVGQCTLDPAAATSTIGVQVMDDDLGVATDTVVVGQTLTLCLNYATGAPSAAGPGGTCNGGAVATQLPAPYPLTFCINTWTGGLRWSASGQCPAGQRTHIVPGSGPLSYCAHTWTGALRVPWLPGQCHAYEMPGVIPG